MGYSWTLWSKTWLLLWWYRLLKHQPQQAFIVPFLPVSSPSSIRLHTSLVVYHPRSVFAADRPHPQYSHANAELGKAASSDCGSAIHLPTEGAQTTLRPIWEVSETAKNLIDKNSPLTITVDRTWA